MNKNMEPPCSDKVIKEKTGRDWKEWCNLLDADGAKELEHKELAKLVASLHNAGDWWSQTVAVGYERLKGKRSLHQRSDGTFSMSTSKTLPISAEKAHEFFVKEKKRSLWLKENLIIRKETAPKSVRITWPDKTSVAVWITAKGDTKCTISLEHSKLNSHATVAPRKEFWKAAFQRLTKVAV
jgi:hypothetical protein